jgi:hypothetical protein
VCVAALLGAALLAISSCGPVEPPAGVQAPVNSCNPSASDGCNSYGDNLDAGPASCTASGFCAVSTDSLPHVLFVVELAQDSFFDPGGTIVVPYEHLFDAASDACAPPGCGTLPNVVSAQGSYLMNPCVQSPSSECAGQGLDFNLGNGTPPGSAITALPVTAAFRMRKDPWQDDVVALGLPLQPVIAQPFVNSGGAFQGPNGGPSFAFETSLESNGVYERTIVPDAPYSAVFGPEVSTTTAMVGPFDQELVTQFDVTTEEPGLGPTLPTFSISRADGLDGWTAYLRDGTTGSTISNVRSLAGSVAQDVLLVTRRPGESDALDDAVLVVAPPPGMSVPTGLFAPQGGELPPQLTYPPLPAAVTVRGSIVVLNGATAGADLIFQASSILEENGMPNTNNFEFTAYASAEPPASGAAPTYSVMLPPGQYLASVRPTDRAGAVTTYNLSVPLVATLEQDFLLSSQRLVVGSATVVDNRPLAAATVEAVPIGCSAPTSSVEAGASPLPSVATTSACLPRDEQTTTLADGSFSIALDPGDYRLRVEPAAGTNLPWVTQSLVVGGQQTSLDAQASTPAQDAASDAGTMQAPIRFVVPAPANAGMQLKDSLGNSIVNAVVRAFWIPAVSTSAGASPSVPLELGRGFTDTSGQYDLYVDPTAQ